jgi:hypothetical protein
MTDLTNAPFTKKEVKSLNGYQMSGVGHPFTCGNNSKHILVATRNGWVCPKCDYSQKWAHKFMADGSWEQMKAFEQRLQRFCWKEGEIVLEHSDIKITEEQKARANKAIDEVIEQFNEIGKNRVIRKT